MIRRRGDVSSHGFVSVFYVCGEKEHSFERVEGTAAPILMRCTKCGTWGYFRHRGVSHRNGRIVTYTCSTSGCKRAAKIRSKLRSTGGLYEWACTPAHATAKKFKPDTHDAAALPPEQATTITRRSSHPPPAHAGA